MKDLWCPETWESGNIADNTIREHLCDLPEDDAEVLVLWPAYNLWGYALEDTTDGVNLAVRL